MNDVHVTPGDSTTDQGDASHVHDETSSKARSGGLNGPGGRYALIAGGLSLAAILVGYVAMRWAPDPTVTTTILLALILVTLAAFGYLATRKGHAAAFVVTALLLPYAVAGSVAYASMHRVADELSTVFDDSSWESDGTGGDMGAPEEYDEHFDESAEEMDGPVEVDLDGGTFTWPSGVTMTTKIEKIEPWGSTDDYCGDGSCGISNPDDTRMVLRYDVKVPESFMAPFDPLGCPGELHIASGNDDEALISVSGDHEKTLDGKIMAGASKFGVDEYSIEKTAVGQDFYIESYCGDESMSTAAYFVGKIG